LFQFRFLALIRTHRVLLGWDQLVTGDPRRIIRSAETLTTKTGA